MVINPNYGLDLSTDLGGNGASDYAVASQKAIKTYVDSKTVSSISDVTLSNLQSGDVLGYNGSNWTNVQRAVVTFRDWS